MNAVFEVKEVVSDWNPPFAKKVSVEQFNVAERADFSLFDGLNENVFRVLKVEDGKALIQYHYQFSLKEYARPQNRQLWMEAGKPVSFTFLWGDKGITKTLMLKGVAGEAA